MTEEQYQAVEALWHKDGFTPPAREFLKQIVDAAVGMTDQTNPTPSVMDEAKELPPAGFLYGVKGILDRRFPSEIGGTLEAAREIAAYALTPPKADTLCDHGHTDPMALCSQCEAREIEGSAKADTDQAERVKQALEQQMEENEEVMALPASICRERGLVWLEGWFDLRAAINALGDERARVVEEAAKVACADWDALKPYVDAAALRWCGEKDRETFNGDIDYFKHHWQSSGGLLKYVIAASIRALSTPAPYSQKGDE